MSSSSTSATGWPFPKSRHRNNAPLHWGLNVSGASIEVGGEESLRLEFACRIANEKPTDWHWRHSAAIPDGGAAGDFDEAVGSAVPETDAVALPGYLGILEDGAQPRWRR